MKNKVFMMASLILFVATACNKSKPYPLHNGTYIGQFSFTDYPQFNFTDTFTVFVYNKRTLYIYTNSAINTSESVLSSSGYYGGIRIKNYDFIPDSVPNHFSLREQKVEKNHITIEFGTPHGDINYQGTFELNYIKE